MEIKKLYTGRAIASFLLVLFSMPLGHGLMIAMEKTMSGSSLMMEIRPKKFQLKKLAREILYLFKLGKK